MKTTCDTCEQIDRLWDEIDCIRETIYQSENARDDVADGEEGISVIRRRIHWLEDDISVIKWRIQWLEEHDCPYDWYNESRL